MSGFKDVVGHSEIIQYIQNAVTEDKVSHAYILNGEKGSGKKMLAGLFAQTLQCEKGGAEPCYECHSCKQAVSGNHPDIIWVTHEKPNSISVDDIRVQINGDIQVKPYNGEYKIYIVPDADMMTVQAEDNRRATCLCGNSASYRECEQSAPNDLLKMRYAEAPQH